MEINITLRDTADGLVEIEETRLPYSDENIKSVTVASALADELRRFVESMGETKESTIEEKS